LNLVLTKDCAKECSFCFTGEKIKGHEMEIPYIEGLIKKNPEVIFSLIGGEPTQHPEFLKIMDVTKKTKGMRLVSNCLFSSKKREAIIDSRIFNILANGMELDEKNRMTLFRRNWNALINTDKIMTLSLTISKTSTVEYFEDYIDFLSKNLDNLDSLRIGLDLSSNYLINNTYMGDVILSIQKKLPTAKISFDCQIPPCIFNYDPNTELYNYTNLESICNSPAIDVFDDGSAIYCYQKQNMKIEDISPYNIKDLFTEFRKIYKKEERKASTPTECQICKYYLSNRCFGLCLGCQSDVLKEIGLETIT
jgi:hypothetical protein